MFGVFSLLLYSETSPTESKKEQVKKVVWVLKVIEVCRVNKREATYRSPWIPTITLCNKRILLISYVDAFIYAIFLFLVSSVTSRS